MNILSVENWLLTIINSFASMSVGNTPVSFGEGARSRSERIGSCFFQGVSA